MISYVLFKNTIFGVLTEKMSCFFLMQRKGMVEIVQAILLFNNLGMRKLSNGSPVVLVII